MEKPSRGQLLWRPEDHPSPVGNMPAGEGSCGGGGAPRDSAGLCRPLLLLPPIPPSIRVFSNESTLLMSWPKYWSFTCSFPGENARSWEALGEARPGQSSLSAGALRYRAWAQSWSSAALGGKE